MAKLIWNQVGERLYETGVDRGVLYPSLFASGVSWNGLISVSESVSGGEVNNYHYDGVKYLDFVANEDFSATIEAYSAPKEFLICDGYKSLSPGLFATQQPRRKFHFSYRTRIGNDLEGVDHGYKIHLVYNATVAPSSRSNQSVGEQINPDTRQWSVETVPMASSTHRPTAHFVIDSRLVTDARLNLLENKLYGTTSESPMLPTPSQVAILLS